MQNALMHDVCKNAMEITDCIQLKSPESLDKKSIYSFIIWAESRRTRRSLPALRRPKFHHHHRVFRSG